MKMLIKKINLILLVAALLDFFDLNWCSLVTGNTITVYCDRENGIINKNVYGNNIINYYSRWKPYNHFSDFGGGIWDPKWNKPVKEVVHLAKTDGITMMRYPGGCGTHNYDWKETIGKKRNRFLFGLNEFLRTCEEIGAKAVITVSYFTGNEQDAADLVEYLNCPHDASNRNSGKDWAAERAKNGHPLPYNVRYFEIGNEVYHGDHKDIKKILPKEYAYRYLKYYEAMKAVDPSIKIGVVLTAYPSYWNRKVLEIVKDSVDFGIDHSYPTPTPIFKEEPINSKKLFRITLGLPALVEEVRFQETLKLLKKNAHRDIPLAITEYNFGHFLQDEPETVPYRHSLGTALLNAELLRVFMHPGNNILMANHWFLLNNHSGSVANGFPYKPLYNQYYKRPNFYVFELYNKYFGDVLLDVSVECDTYDLSDFNPTDVIMRNFLIKKGTVIGETSLPDEWVITKLPGVFAEQKRGKLRIDFNNPERFNYYHSKKSVQVQPDTYYKLSGYIKTNKLVDKIGVCLEVQDGRGWVQTHSAAQTEKITGTTDWQYLETIYKTLPDANSVILFARRYGLKGPLRGSAFFKGVKLQEFIPEMTRVPYLSVNASRSPDGKRIYLMVINKNLDESVTSTINLVGFVPDRKVNVWILNGPSVDATNEKNPNNVKVTHKKFKILSSDSEAKNSFQFVFEPHSLTAIEINGKCNNMPKNVTLN